jgi:hypothetical protein
MEEHHGIEVGNDIVNRIGCLGGEERYDAEGWESLEGIVTFTVEK